MVEKSLHFNQVKHLDLAWCYSNGFLGHTVRGSDDSHIIEWCYLLYLHTHKNVLRDICIVPQCQGEILPWVIEIQSYLWRQHPLHGRHSDCNGFLSPWKTYSTNKPNDTKRVFYSSYHNSKFSVLIILVASRSSSWFQADWRYKYNWIPHWTRYHRG